MNVGDHAQPARALVRQVSVLLLVVEAIALVSAGVFSFVTLRSSQAQSLGVSLALFFGIIAVALVLAAVSLWNFGRFGVSFSVTWQLFQALVGASLLRGGMISAGVYCIVMAVLVFVLLLKPGNKPTRRNLLEDSPHDTSRDVPRAT